MGISLFPHNAAAYEAAVTMLTETGKAAVIHPTGTGKSFIAFKLCEDYPNATVCWLSPSEYIFQTQLENLRAVTGSYAPENIVFLTYAKLMLLQEEELRELRPDFIILDEFHRCGAEMWGRGVECLMNTYPDVPVLGLSATNIRYLDNRRDMAEELFDGNIASEMTLGEAVVRGILNPPKYVLSVFSYQNELEKYEKRIRLTKSRAVRDKAEEYLEALRRALEKAEGLDEIFAKHMADRHGKYIVFCANAEHMREMMAKVPEWFGKVDTHLHVYSVYSEEPGTSKAFAEFKADESEHLKLLFCIDMLNEGIHVEQVSGVILLRPTVSPIIYKQQIGRALSASKSRDAVIFDIVLNIENLYSIGAIEEEMRVAMTYYRSLGQEGEIVNEQFRVIDEVRDCVELFDRLNETMTASWELMYEKAVQFYSEHGHLEIPRRYLTADGYSLGYWIQTQRRVYAGKLSGTLTTAQIERLNVIGMRWENAQDAAWNRYFAAAAAYSKEKGNLKVSTNYCTADGLKLGRWLTELRGYRRNQIKCAFLTADRIAALDQIGMVWDVPDYLFERNYAAALRYHREHGNLRVPAKYVDADGIRLGMWLVNLRTARKNRSSTLNVEQVARLDELGMQWGSRYESDWEQAYAAARQYQEQYGDLNIPVSYMTEEGLRLGRWIRRQREAMQRGTLSRERKQKLDALGMTWGDAWEEKYQLLEQYYREHGDLRIPSNYVVNGVWLSRWLYAQKKRLEGQGKPLTEGQRQKLIRLGIPSGKHPYDLPESLERKYPNKRDTGQRPSI